MSVTITTVASLIAALGAPVSPWTAGSGGGNLGATLNERSLGTNGIIDIGGTFYVVLLLGDGTMQMYRSTDSGVTWSTYGSAFTPTHSGGGMVPFASGGSIVVAYTQRDTAAALHTLWLNSFDTAAGTWGTEASFNLGLRDGLDSMAPEVYWACTRPDGSWAIAGTAAAAPSDILVVTYHSGVLSGPYFLTGPFAGAIFESAAMRSDGTVDVFYIRGSTFYHNTLSPANAIGTEVAIPFAYNGATGSILAWNDDGLEYGYEKSGTFYLAVGKKTVDYPTIWGRPAILFGNDSGWTMGAILDAGFDADYSVYSCTLALVNGTLIYSWRGISSDGAKYIERLGHAPEGQHNNPSAWTWTTLYDLDSPASPVSGQAAPYVDISSTGSNHFSISVSSGVTQTSTRLRLVATLQRGDNALFATYLCDVLVTAAVAFGNEFR